MSDKNSFKILKAVHMDKCIGCYACMLACARVVHHDYSPISSAIVIRSSGGLQGKLVADICRGCLQPACAEVCRTQALQMRSGGGIKIDSEKCIGCKKCKDACTVSAIRFDEVHQKPIVCIHCGICAKNCPHEVLVLEGNRNAE